MLEEYLVEHLPRNSLIETFGCELTLINADTQIALHDPIQEDLWKNNHFGLVVHDSFFCMLEDNKLLQDSSVRTARRQSESLSQSIPLNRACHVKLDIGLGTVSPQAWRYCHFLRIVKLPDTVVVMGLQPSRDAYRHRNARVCRAWCPCFL